MMIGRMICLMGSKKKQMREFRFDEKSNEVVIEWEKRMSGEEAAKDLRGYREMKIYELQEIVSKIKALKSAANEIRDELRAIEDLEDKTRKTV